MDCFSNIHLQIGLELFFYRDNVTKGGYQALSVKATM